MLSLDTRKRFRRLISIVLCLAILTTSSPLAVGPAPQPPRRLPARAAHSAPDQSDRDVRSVPTPSAATSRATRSPPLPGAESEAMPGPQVASGLASSAPSSKYAPAYCLSSSCKPTALL